MAEAIAYIAKLQAEYRIDEDDLVGLLEQDLEDFSEVLEYLNVDAYNHREQLASDPETQHALESAQVSFEWCINEYKHAAEIYTGKGSGLAACWRYAKLLFLPTSTAEQLQRARLRLSLAMHDLMRHMERCNALSGICAGKVYTFKAVLEDVVLPQTKPVADQQVAPSPPHCIGLTMSGKPCRRSAEHSYGGYCAWHSLAVRLEER